MSKSLLKEINNEIKKIATELGLEPWQISKADFYAEQDRITDWQIRQLGGFEALKKRFFPQQDKALDVIAETSSAKSYVAKLEKQLGNKQLFEQSVLKILTSKLKPLPTLRKESSKKKQKISRAVNLVYSDLHFGSDIKASETGNLDYGKIEESRRLARITKEAMEYKSQYRDHTELNLLLLGDIIQNQLHDQRDGAPLAEQICRSIHLLGQSIAHLVTAYPKVTVYCTTGNHGRSTSRHKQRATDQKWDSHESVIYFALKNMFKNNKNISFIIPKTPYGSYEVFGSKVFYTHGDTVLTTGYPSKSVQTAKLEEQINKINASLPNNQEYSVFIAGHVHIGSVTHLANGAVMITNPALVPSDQYAVSIGLLENSCGQYLFESSPGFPVGDMRFLKVSEKDDKDKSLDSIIKPFENL